MGLNVSGSFGNHLTYLFHLSLSRRPMDVTVSPQNTLFAESVTVDVLWGQVVEVTLVTQLIQFIDSSFRNVLVLQDFAKIDHSLVFIGFFVQSFDAFRVKKRI